MGSPDDVGSAGSWPNVLHVVEWAGEWDRIAPSETNTNIKMQCSFRLTNNENTGQGTEGEQ